MASDMLSTYINSISQQIFSLNNNVQSASLFLHVFSVFESKNGI